MERLEKSAKLLEPVFRAIQNIILILAAVLAAVVFFYSPFIKNLQLTAREQASWNLFGFSIGVFLSYHFSKKASKREAMSEVRGQARSAVRHVLEVREAAKIALKCAEEYREQHCSSDEVLVATRFTDLSHQMEAIHRSVAGFEYEWKDILEEEFEQQGEYIEKLKKSEEEKALLLAELNELFDNLTSTSEKLEESEKARKDLKTRYEQVTTKLAEVERRQQESSQQAPFPTFTSSVSGIKKFPISFKFLEGLSLEELRQFNDSLRAKYDLKDNS